MKAAITELCIGQTASQAKVFTNADVERYSELTSDFNEVYDRNAEIWKKHYKRAVVPGLLVEGLLNQVISTQLPGGPCVMLQKELVFLHPVHVGDKITVELEIIDIFASAEIKKKKERKGVKYRSVWPNRTILDYLNDSVKKFPQKTAIIDKKSRYTYSELNKMVDRVALGLLELGLEKGDCISLQLPNWNEFVILHLAATRIGAFTNPMIPIYREREISYMVGLVKAKMLVIPDEFRGFDYTEMVRKLRGKWPFLEHVFVIGDKIPDGMRSLSELFDTSWGEKRMRPSLMKSFMIRMM